MNDFVDAQEMHRMFPDKFEIPSEKELRKLKIGDIVKVCHNEERFWTIVKRIRNDTIYAKVDNDLVLKHDFKLGDTIKFEKKNIYAIFEV